MKLEPLMNYHANLTNAHEIGKGPFGNRLIVEVDGGAFEGPKLKGEFLKPSAADWLNLSDDGYGHPDVRITAKTHDGALIYIEYFGKLELNDHVQKALAGEGNGTNYGDQYFFTSPRMQTGDPRYQWVNNIVCVAQGRLLPGRVEYQVFQVVND